MFKIIIVLIGLFIVALIGLFIAFHFIGNSEDKKSVKELLDNTYNSRFKKRGTSYVIVSVVGDKVEYYCYGYSTSKTNPIQTDSMTMFDIASLGKLFTSTTVKVLDKSKKININEPIASNFKDCVGNLSNFKDVTYSHLINHTSGFPSLPENMIEKMKKTHEAENPYKVISVQDVFDYLESCKNRDTEERSIYSNFGYGLIGISLSLELKQDFEQIVQENLFSKIEMNNTFIPKDGILPNNLIQGYTADKKPAYFWFDDVLPASGSFVSNGKDLANFILYQFGYYGDNIYVPNDMSGWEHEKKVLNQPEYYWHNGMSGGYYSFLAIDKKNKVGVAILSNEAKMLTYQQIRTFEIIRKRSLKKQIKNFDIKYFV